MLAKRIIPCLDVHAGRVVKGVNFLNLRDAGDPVDVAARYEQEGADELVFLDITASHEQRDIMLEVVQRTSEVCFMPLTVGGGIRTLEDIRRLLKAGCDKVSINTAAVKNPQFIREAALRFGSQCIVVNIDPRRVESGESRVQSRESSIESPLSSGESPVSRGEIAKSRVERGASQEGIWTHVPEHLRVRPRPWPVSGPGCRRRPPAGSGLSTLDSQHSTLDSGHSTLDSGLSTLDSRLSTCYWDVHIHGGRTPTGLDAVAWAREVERLGAGEIVLTSMDADGTKDGYDIEITRAVAEAVEIPVVASGGAGSPAHLYEAVTAGQASAALAASIFHYGEYTIAETKAYLAERGVPVRLC